MTARMEDVERRLAMLEDEVATLRQLITRRQVAESPAERGARLLREAAASQPQLATGWAKAMEMMGIAGAPIGAERVQEMMAACGFKPEDNALSREIIATREE